MFADSSYYYSNNDIPLNGGPMGQIGIIDLNPSADQNSRSPLAATRANSLASANSPTDSGSACVVAKTENIFNRNDLNLG